jgi:hypothetical protein
MHYFSSFIVMRPLQVKITGKGGAGNRRKTSGASPRAIPKKSSGGNQKRLSVASPRASPAIQKAKAVKRKYARPGTPDNGSRARRALYAIREKKVTIRQAARDNDLSFGFVYRRLSGEVEIDKQKGPPQVFNKEEEEVMAKWLREMAERGMGLKPGEFLDFVQTIVQKEKRSTPFKENRPSHDWYYAFMRRNSHIVQMRKETPLESCRAKLTKDKTDKWYGDFRDFLVRVDLICKPSRIWNADETGFCMGSSASKQKVIGPTRKDQSDQVPHISGGHSKQRLTVMYCGCADGSMMPPFMVYPAPQPRGYNPLTGAMEGSAIAYTKKGWMDAETFCKFIDHFDKHAGPERPVVLLIDSVSSHVDMSAFEGAKAKGIEIYRIVPNATHLMQPLDKGVFGPLKTRWHQVVRKHTREHPEDPIGKVNFAEKLKEAFLMFYKPLTVINSFKSSGIYPLDSTVISSDQLKPGITYMDAEEPSTSTTPDVPEEPSTSTTPDVPLPTTTCDEIQKASGALAALESVLSTPIRETYHKRLQEGYDIEGKSPCFDAFRKLHRKAKGEDMPVAVTPETEQSADISGLDLLAEAAEQMATPPPLVDETKASKISTSMQEALVFPKAPESSKPKRKTLLSTLPDNLTSGQGMRAMALRQLDTIRKFANKEQRAKQSYLKAQNDKGKRGKSVKTKVQGKGKRRVCKTSPVPDASEENVECMGCHMSWLEDMNLGTGSLWVMCEKCSGWMHSDCSSIDIPSDDEPFCCPECQS